MGKVSERRCYPREFKLEAVRLSEKPGVSARSVARDLGVSAKILYRWRHQLLTEPVKTGSPPEDLEALKKEYQRLQKEHRKLLEERAILKKAIRYFATEE
jgi:transposase